MPQDLQTSDTAAEVAASSSTNPALRADFAGRTRRLDIAMALDLLRARSCPVCEFARGREGKFFLWFALEHYLDFGTIERLDAALGFCPRHCRALIRLGTYPGTLTNIYGHVVRAALRRLREPMQEGECIACEHERWAVGHAIDVIGKALVEESVAVSYRESEGYCASHLLAALARGTREKAGLLLDGFLDHLDEGASSPDAVQLFAGSDPDADALAALIQRLPVDPLDATERGRVITTRDRLVALLRAGSCPACLAAGQAARRYLRWVGLERERKSSDFGREVAGLCTVHLADLARLDPESALWLACQKTSLWRGLLARFRKQSLSGKPRSLIGRLRARSPNPLPGEPRRHTEILAEFLRETLTPSRQWERAIRGLAVQLPWCGACNAEKTAAERITALLIASVADASLLPLYEGSHGLCVRHVLALSEADRAVPLRVCRARLDWLAWELDEAGRKQNWLTRYEKRGDETNAWLRAMAQIDGRVFLGGDPAASF